MKSVSLAIVFLIILFGCSGPGDESKLTEINFAKDFISSDTLFNSPYVDIDEWRETPVPHRYVHGGFEGTETRFSFYFPPKEKYEGRFFQYITPFPDNENLSQGATGEQDKIGFSLESGAYFVETNGGGAIDFSNPRANDPTIGAYRANAASAQFSRVVAQKLFGGDRPFGYSFGGSGGAYRTVGGIENTTGVWDGAVPYVLGSPMAIPNVFSVRMHAMRILKDKFPQIIDAVDAGGSGDMYAGLNVEERAALEEVTKMGFPPQSWYAYESMGIHGFLVLYQGVVAADGKYFTEDFWNKPGYLGASPTQSLLKARIQKKSTIKAAIGLDQAIELGLTEPVSEEDRGSADLAWKSAGGSAGNKPVAFELEDIMPDVDFLGGDLLILSGEAAGQKLQITKVDGNKVVLANANPTQVLVNIQPGDAVQVDNSNFLAVQTYHRHQVPGPEYTVWDQFRNEAGEPLYPQRPMLLGPLFTLSASGSIPTGKFDGKMILLGSLMDREAYPWQCGWYRNRVTEHLGEKTDDHFRLWYTDHAIHGDGENQLDDPTRAVSYIGVLQQTLRDLSAWVEKGSEPAATTSYQVKDGQVIIPPTATERKGIQPVVSLKANGSKKAIVKVGEEVSFTADVAVPENQGKVISAAWDFDGSGDYKEQAKMGTEMNSKATISTTHKFSKPGTYFVTLRAFAQRDGDSDTAFARIQNLDRVRVVVQ
tara:strand:+ start:49532 stop:51652 length:2121 start_codon:yes stop_codon:yes gene_type:complete